MGKKNNETYNKVKYMRVETVEGKKKTERKDKGNKTKKEEKKETNQEKREETNHIIKQP